MALPKELNQITERAKQKRRALKRIVNAGKHLQGASDTMAKTKRRAALLNVEFAYDGNILFDVDLEDYPEITDEVVALCERIRQLAQTRIEGADI